MILKNLKMTININFDKKKFPEINLQMVEAAIRMTLESSNKQEVEITLQLIGDEEMRQLNQVYRDIYKTTDVLSFNQDYVDPETKRLYLGDIVISIDQAQSQAQEHHLSLSEECAFLAIHGTLHLLGFDHSSAADKEEMWKKQDIIFKELILIFQEDSK